MFSMLRLAILSVEASALHYCSCQRALATGTVQVDMGSGLNMGPRTRCKPI